MFFGWLRQRARDAVLAGCGDALQELDNHGNGDMAPALAALRARLLPALPAPAPEVAQVEEPPPAPSRSKRRAE